MTVSPLGAITAIAHVTTKQDLSRWTRAHADAPGITWSVIAGDGGTMIIIEHAHNRATVPAAVEPHAERPAAPRTAAA